MHVLVITSLSLPALTAGDVTRIEEAAGDGARVSIVESEEDALRLAADAEVIMGFVSPALLDAAPRLRWVHANASGVNRYLYPAFRDGDVILTSAKGLVGNPLADHAFALLLALTRKVAAAVRLGPQSWERRAELRRGETELEGQVMGIVGFGGTGRALARRAAGFGMRCIAVDRDEVAGGDGVESVLSLDRFDELLATSDVVAICCPLTDETHNLFGRRQFERMKASAYLINVTRGEIVDAGALLEALEDDAIAGAGLDVTPTEPLPAAHPLWRLENVVMTPHAAGASQQRAERGVDRFCENLVRFRRGQPLEGLIDKQAGY